jgi:colicin import membrane protein
LPQCSARSSQEQPRAEQPGAARSSQEQPGAAKSSQEQPGAARSSQEQPEAARSSQEQPGAARSSRQQQAAAGSSRKQQAAAGSSRQQQAACLQAQALDQAKEENRKLELLKALKTKETTHERVVSQHKSRTAYRDRKDREKDEQKATKKTADSAKAAAEAKGKADAAAKEEATKKREKAKTKNLRLQQKRQEEKDKSGLDAQEHARHNYLARNRLELFKHTGTPKGQKAAAALSRATSEELEAVEVTFHAAADADEDELTRLREAAEAENLPCAQEAVGLFYTQARLNLKRKL